MAQTRGNLRIVVDTAARPAARRPVRRRSSGAPGRSWYSHLTIVVLALGVAYGTVRFDDLAAMLGVGSDTPSGTAGTPAGLATATDGDTIRIGEDRIRLYGIDAAESGQTCAASHGGRWNCGAAARERLATLLATGPVACAGDERDLYGRLVAVCTAADGTPINATLVLEGLAWAYVDYASDYVDEEASARITRRGIWQANTMPPWEYRRL